MKDTENLDGWDLGILIVIHRRNYIGHKSIFSVINSELISEVGWLKGGTEELEERLAKLERQGLLAKEVTPLFSGDKRTWSITEKARERFEGLRP